MAWSSVTRLVLLLMFRDGTGDSVRLCGCRYFFDPVAFHHLLFPVTVRGLAGEHGGFKMHAVPADFEFPDTAPDGNGGFHDNQDIAKTSILKLIPYHNPGNGRRLSLFMVPSWDFFGYPVIGKSP